MEQDFYGKMCPPLQNKYHLWPDVCIMMCVLYFQLTLLCRWRVKIHMWMQKGAEDARASSWSRKKAERLRHQKQNTTNKVFSGATFPV